MAKVVVIDDYREYAEMCAAPLARAGHGVIVETPPIDFERIVQMQPSVLVLAVYRKAEAYDRPIRDPVEDVTGYAMITAVEGYPALNAMPIAIVAIGLKEKDLPTSVAYDLFLTLPEDARHFADRIEELASRARSRQRITAYACPECEGRLITYDQPPGELLCPRCDTTVVLEGQEAIILPPGLGGQSYTLPLSHMRPGSLS